MRSPDRPMWLHERMALVRPLLDAFRGCVRGLRAGRTASRAAAIADAMQAGDQPPRGTPLAAARAGQQHGPTPASGRGDGGPGPLPDVDRGRQKDDPHKAGRKEIAMNIAQAHATPRHLPRRARDRALLRWWPHMQQGMALRIRSTEPHWPLIRGKGGAR